MAANQSIRILVANDAPITAYERCCVFDQLLGDDDRAFTKGIVFNGVLGSFALTAGTRAVTIAGGMASIDGRQFVSSSAVTFDLSALTGVKYCVIYVEVSTMSVANEFAKLCLAFDSGSFPTMEGNDVVRQERGVARMPLHRFIYSAAGGIVRDAVQLFEGKEPGTAFQTRHIRDEATIYGNDVDELIEENEPYFAKSRNADQTGDVPDLSGNEIDGALCVNNSLASLAVLAFATVTLTPDTCGGHEGGDGASVTAPNESGEATLEHGIHRHRVSLGNAQRARPQHDPARLRVPQPLRELERRDKDPLRRHSRRTASTGQRGRFPPDTNPIAY